MTAFQYLGRGKLGIWIFLFSVFVKLTQMLRFKCHCELGRGRETTAASFDEISDAERGDTDVARPELRELEEHR